MLVAGGRDLSVLGCFIQVCRNSYLLVFYVTSCNDFGLECILQ